MMLRALFSAIGQFLKFLHNAKQMGLVNCLCGQGVRDGVVFDMGLIRYFPLRPGSISFVISFALLLFWRLSGRGALQ